MAVSGMEKASRKKSVGKKAGPKRSQGSDLPKMSKLSLLRLIKARLEGKSSASTPFETVWSAWIAKGGKASEATPERGVGLFEKISRLDAVLAK